MYFSLTTDIILGSQLNKVTIKLLIMQDSFVLYTNAIHQKMQKPVHRTIKESKNEKRKKEKIKTHIDCWIDMRRIL